MKKILSLRWAVFCTFTVIFFYACKKESSPGQKTDLTQKEAVNKTNVWLESQKSAGDQGKNDKIQLLKEKLDYSNLWFEKLRDGEQFIIVPVKDGFTTMNNKDKSPISVLLLILNNKGLVRKGNIAQYIPESRQANTAIPINSFSKIFNAEAPVEDAQFSFLAITDKLEYEIKFKNGRMVSTGKMRSSRPLFVANRPPQDPIGPVPMCIDWYLVTIYYYPDGSTSQTEEYVYTTCEPTSGGGGGDGGGSGDNDIAYEFEVATTVDWTVAVNPVSGVGEIKSLERLKGRKMQSEPQGGHFKSIAHYESICNFCSSSDPNNVWIEQSNNVSASGQQASSSVSGKLRYEGFNYYPSNTQTWSFQEVFPN